MKRKTPTLALLGSYPPPYGGVTIHTRRLCRLFEGKGVDYIVYNAASETEDGTRVFSVYRKRHVWMIWYALFGREPVVYIMSPRLMSWMLGAFMAGMRGKKVILRIQNSRLIDWCAKSSPRRFLASFSLRRISQIISVNREIYNQLIELGVEPGRAHVFPGFLPPVPNDFGSHAVAPEIMQFAANHAPLIAANGKISFYQGEDLYGLDLLIELAIQLKPDYPNLGIVFFFSDFSGNNQAYLDKLLAKAERSGVEKNLFFNIGGGPFLPVIKVADLFVRPTNTDGDANSIREALYLGVPVVASDAVERPEKVILFKSRNIDHFVRQTRLALAEKSKKKFPEEVIDSETNSLIENYLEVLLAPNR
jgi:glycosyltransferase involved in cell wall biosynthesis